MSKTMKAIQSHAKHRVPMLPNLLVVLTGLLIGVSCSSGEKETQAGSVPLVDEKYSLTSDRKAMDELRKDVPVGKKKEADELAFVLGLISEPSRKPSEIRSAFDQVIRKKRDLFDKDLRKEREEFNKLERKERDQFLKEVKAKKDAFMKEKKSREERSEFFREIDAKRNEFFSNERDRRQEFESDIREKRKNFEDYITERRNFFTQEMRSFTQRHDEWKKQKEQEKKDEQSKATSPAPNSNFGQQKQLNSEFDEIQTKKGTPLESGE